LRREHPILRRSQFFEGLYPPGSDIKDLAWFKPDGDELMDEDWTAPENHCMGMRVSGLAADEGTAHGPDDTLLLLLNAGGEEVAFTLPVPGMEGHLWEVLLDTTREGGQPGIAPGTYEEGRNYPLTARSLALLRRAPSELPAL
jgi:glycogen operon protein